jgi:hypothetical protein
MLNAPKLTGLSGNEIYCMRLKGLIPSGVVIGNSIQSMGFLGGVRSAFRGIVGGEIPDVTQMIHEDAPRPLPACVRRPTASRSTESSA